MSNGLGIKATPLLADEMSNAAGWAVTSDQLLLERMSTMLKNSMYIYTGFCNFRYGSIGGNTSMRGKLVTNKFVESLQDLIRLMLQWNLRIIVYKYKSQ